MTTYAIANVVLFTVGGLIGFGLIVAAIVTAITDQFYVND